MSYFSQELMQRVLDFLEDRATHGGCTIAEIERHTARRADTIAKVLRVVGRKTRDGTVQRDAVYLPHPEARQRMANHQANTYPRAEATLREKRLALASVRRAAALPTPALRLSVQRRPIDAPPTPAVPPTPEAVQRAILRSLRIADESLTEEEILRQTALAPDAVRAALAVLRGDGRIVKLLRIRPGRAGNVTTIAYALPSTRGAA